MKINIDFHFQILVKMKGHEDVVGNDFLDAILIKLMWTMQHQNIETSSTI